MWGFLLSRFAVYHWIKTKAIKPEAALKALQLAGERTSPDSWPSFIRRLLWILGCLSLVVALLFFIAFNWQIMGPMFKFALLQGSLLLVLLLCALWSWVLVPRYAFSQQTIELGQTIAQVVLALLVGGLLALYGQVYQTGADPWQLFALWSVLISVMVVTSGQALMWVLWSVLINVAVVLYVDTRPMWLLLMGGTEQAIWLFLMINGLLWLILLWLDGEHPHSLGFFKRLRPTQRWALQLQALVLLLCFTYMGMAAILDGQKYGVVFGLTSALGLAAFYAYYRHIRLDSALLALWAMSLISLTFTLVMNIIDGWDSGFNLFLLSMLLIAMTTAAVKWLKAVRTENVRQNVADISHQNQQ